MTAKTVSVTWPKASAPAYQPLLSHHYTATHAIVRGEAHTLCGQEPGEGAGYCDVSNGPVECKRCLKVLAKGPAKVACRVCGSKFTPTLLELAAKHEFGGIDCGPCQAADHAAECRSLEAAETGAGRESYLDDLYHRTHG